MRSPMNRQMMWMGDTGGHEKRWNRLVLLESVN